jgi:hypothetical protein
MLIQDLKYAFRAIRVAPAFSAIVVMTIALGLGANTAIFSAVDAVILRPLPFGYSGRLVSLWATNPDKTVPRFGVSWIHWRRYARSEAPCRRTCDSEMLGYGPYCQGG